MRISDQPAFIVAGPDDPEADRAACGVYAMFAAARTLGRDDVSLADVVRPVEA